MGVHQPQGAHFQSLSSTTSLSGAHFEGLPLLNGCTMACGNSRSGPGSRLRQIGNPLLELGNFLCFHDGIDTVAANAVHRNGEVHEVSGN